MLSDPQYLWRKNGEYLRRLSIDSRTPFFSNNLFLLHRSEWVIFLWDRRILIDSLTEHMLGAVFEVSNTLGAGFLEKVYERALLGELALLGIRATSQASFAITYKGHHVGD